MRQLDSSINFEDYLTFIGEQEKGALRLLSEVKDKIWTRIVEGPKCPGDKLPFRVSEGKFAFRPNEVTIWAGYNKHGKSKILSHCLAAWAQKMPVCQISLEMPIETLGWYYVRQAAGARVVSQERMIQILAAVEHSYWVYDETDSIDSDRVLGVAAYAAGELGCKHVVIDSLVKCKLSLDQRLVNQAQRDFMDRLSWLAKRFHTHIHLVHHMRKAQTEDSPGTKFDVKGAGELVDLCDNVLLIWRNKPKERERRSIEEGIVAPPGELQSEPDTLLTVAGQRYFEWEGHFDLWFDLGSQQFLECRNDYPCSIVPLLLAKQGDEKEMRYFDWV